MTAHVCVSGKNAQTVEREMESEEKSLGLEDLLTRIENIEAEAKQEIGDQDDPRAQRRNADRRHGVKRYEAIFNVETLVSLFHKIFNWKERT